jgi:pimeloyl-ACP methyl ester carboxylesterase
MRRRLGTWVPVGLVLAAGGALVAAGQRARLHLRAGYPPPGRMVDVGGYRLHLVEEGEGSPTVVIDTGQGDFTLTWRGIVRRVAEFTRVCAYDRAGLGWSETSPEPRTAEVMVEELHALLTRTGVPGPYVLVGASLGGMNVRLYAHTHPDEVAGLVLVDAAHEEQFTAPEVREAAQRMEQVVPLVSRVLAGLVRSGIPALWPGLLPDVGGIRARLPAEDVPAYDAVVAANPKHLLAAAAEIRDLPATRAQMVAADITSLGDRPLVVLRHGREQPMMGPPEVTQALEETFTRLQEQTARLSTNGRLIVAEESGHAIHLEQPDLVVDAIRQVVEDIRRRG